MVNGFFKLMGFKLVSIKGIQGDKDKWLQYIEENLDFLFLIVILSHKYAMN